MQRRVLLLICWIKQPYELALVLYQQAALFCKQKSPLNPTLLSLPPATLLALTMVESQWWETYAHSPTFYFKGTAFVGFCSLQSYESGSLHCYSLSASAQPGKDILDFLVSKGRREWASCQTPAGIAMFISTPCWCSRHWDELTHTHCFCPVPPKITRNRQRLGAALEMCPDKAASSAVQGGSAASWKGTPALERLGTTAASMQETTTISPNVNWNQKHPRTENPESR